MESGPNVSPITWKTLIIGGLELIGVLPDDFSAVYSVTLEKRNPPVLAIRSRCRHDGGILAWVMKQNADFFVSLVDEIGLENIIIRPITSTYRIKSKETGIFENRQKISVVLRVNAEKHLEAILERIEKEGLYWYAKDAI